MLTTLERWFSNATAAQDSSENGCLCCGECCKSFGGHLHASQHDLERWQREERNDLLSRVNRLGWIWVDPVTKEIVDLCPFILKIDEEKSICAINDTKPAICRDYPTLAHGRRCLRGGFLK